MNIVPSEGLVLADPLARRLVSDLRSIFRESDTSDFWFYHSFPLYKDSEGQNVLADALLVTPKHGVVAFALPAGKARLSPTMTRFEQVPAHIHSRLIRTKSLRKGLSTLIPCINAAIALFDETSAGDSFDGIPIISGRDSLETLLESISSEPLATNVFSQLLATIDGAKGLIRPQPRQDPNAGSKAQIAYLVETAINDFDLYQKHGMFGGLTGPTRIRGIAGSGKTVVLAMKAALIHLANPDAHILYTFYTKSLFQHVQRLITRFYRQFDDRDPNWDRIHIMHAWGGKTTPGVYYNQAKRLGIEALTYRTARVPSLLARLEPFEYACKQIEDHSAFSSAYDYVLVDEAQDFPPSFIRLCHRLAHEGRFVFAYDELQNIFQTSAPTVESIFGGTVSLADDVVLRVCYRNPKEILLCAHAVGFGFYGTKMVQTLDGPQHWESLGYKIVSGSFEEGDTVVVERPDDTSLTVVSSNTDVDSIVSALTFNNQTDETEAVARWIIDDVKVGGLHPDDIMVVSVDDRNARTYLRQIQHHLVNAKIPVNNVHEDTGSLKSFWIDGHATLTTVHKAKGNEAFAVYVVGCDAPMRSPNVRNRNILFTAMTRAKAWLRVTGVGQEAEELQKEIQRAKELCPRLQFSQPSPAEIELIRRDIADSIDRKAKVQKVLSDLLDLTDEVDADEIMTLLRQSKNRERRRKATDD